MPTIIEPLSTALTDCYRIGRELGGGTASVQLAHDLRTPRANHEFFPMARQGRPGQSAERVYPQNLKGLLKAARWGSGRPRIPATSSAPGSRPLR